MRITILHQAISEESAVDEQDVLRQRDAVRDALLRLGHEVTVTPCTLALDQLRTSLLQERPDVVFNLIESLAGSDRLMAIVPLLLESLELPYTGVPAAGIQVTSSKTTAKKRLAQVGLPTLPWVDGESGEAALNNAESIALSWPGRWVFKPIHEHASLGMTDDAVAVCRSLADVNERLLVWQQRLGRPCLAEPYIEGRELNLSLLAGSDGPIVLPAAEIDFHDYPAGKPRIVGFAAKWQDDTHEYLNTPRRFSFGEADSPLLRLLADLARRCWHEFALSGYCRVDFRVDELGRPWILEINANPCLSPDAGFAAAVQAAGMTYDEAIASLLHDAISRRANCTGPQPADLG
jgi:D-alanine-D-alanine ligase